MCGRYTLKRKDRIAAYGCDILQAEWPALVERFNVAPSQELPIALLNDQGAPTATMMRWGMVPYWDKSEKPKIAPINAKSEELLSKKIFAQSVQKRRCLVPADGFYEWKKLGGDLKQPHHIQLKGGEPFFFAGIYERSRSASLGTFALLTTSANALMNTIHDRMPVILRGDAALRWLKAGQISQDEITAMTAPFPADEMEEWPVHNIVGSPKNEGTLLIERAPEGEMRVERPAGEQMALL